MKSLNNVQKASKVLKILSQIAFVCSIVGCAFCAVGMIVVAVWGSNPRIVELFLQVDENFSVKSAMFSLVCGLVESGFMIALYACTVRFYKKELQIGNPFDKDVTTSCRKLGWLTIILTCSAIFAIGIVGACFGMDSSSYVSEGNFIMGVVYLIVSLILAYGTDVKNSNTVLSSTTNSTTTEKEIAETQTTTEENK